MGGLIPIGQGADAEIKDLLNKTFAGVNLDTLQNLYGTEKLFDKDHTLHRVAYRLGCFPKNKYRALRKIAAFLNLCESDCHNRIRGCGYDGSIRFF